MSKFVIPYAHHTCTAEQVSEVFGLKLNIAVHEVICTLKTDRRTARPFQTFHISTYPSERSAAYLADYIDKHGLSKIVYSEPYFWKVVNGS